MRSVLLAAKYTSRFCSVQAYAAAGVKHMYPWQAAALQCGQDGANLVFVAPTSGGKSLVAEVLLIRRLMASQSTSPARPHQKVRAP